MYHIKLDCFSLDSKGLLPDGIKPIRDKKAEAIYRKRTADVRAEIRIEFFEFDNTCRLFNYGHKNFLTNRFEVNDI